MQRKSEMYSDLEKQKKVLIEVKKAEIRNVAVLSNQTLFGSNFDA